MPARGTYPEQGMDTVSGAAKGDQVVAGHRRHLAHPTGLQLRPQPRVGAVDLVAGDPGRRDLASTHRRSRSWPGRVWSQRQPRRGRRPPHAVRIVGPGAGQVQLPVDHGMACLAGVHQLDRDLGVLDPPGGAAVLALHAHGGGALLEVAGLVHHQHCPRIAQVPHEVGADVVADRVVIPDRRLSRCCTPSGLASPACSAIVQQFFLGGSANRPWTNALACRRRSTRANRPATRPINSSNSSSQRAGSTSTLSPAATV
jgi:hypothetical protein